MKLFKTSVPQRSHQLFAIQDRTHYQVLFSPSFLLLPQKRQENCQRSVENFRKWCGGETVQAGVGKVGSVYAGKMLNIIGQAKALGWMGQWPEISRAWDERGEIQRQWHNNKVTVKWWYLEGSQKPGRAASRSEQWVKVRALLLSLEIS